MMKKALIIILTLLPFVAKAQLAVGEWKVYPVFAESITKMLETSEKVYYVSQGNLFSYDKETEETYSYSVVNKLNDKEITNIFYNNENKYLLISYLSGNIDLLYDDGKVINLPDIKDAILTVEKTINDVAFGHNRIYVATIFGLVVFDDQKYYVIDSGIYNKNIEQVEIMGDNVLAYYNYSIYKASKESKFNVFDSCFSYLFGNNCVSMEAINDTKLMMNVKVSNTVYTLKLATINFENNTLTREDIALSDLTKDVKITKCKDGLYAASSSKLHLINNDGQVSSTELPVEMKSKTIALWSGLSSVWAGDGNGIANYDISGETVTVLMDKFAPEGISVKNVFCLSRGNSGKIYIANWGSSNYYKDKCSEWILSSINILQNGKIEKAEPLECPNTNPNGPNYGGSGYLFSTYNVCEDPEDPDTYYVGNFWDGLYKVTNRVSTLKYDWTNSKFTKIEGYACVVDAVAFDRENNLWAMQLVSSGQPVLHMLPAEKRKQTSTVKDDWYAIDLGGMSGFKDCRLLICEKSNVIFMNDWNKLICYDTKGTYTNINDDNYVIWEKFTDQDGKSYEPGYIYAFAEDHNGKVWVCNGDGVFEITKPANAANPSMTINRIKVPRNDGTQFADYLLESQKVTAIAVDNSNRKWLGTEGSGLYLVSENGDEILEHFDTGNSMLPSNNIYSLLCDPNGNSVFIGTDVGLVEYSSSSAPAEEDYSNVYAYPNPVRPDYTGWITIKGLMDNSLVKIADSMGNVFYTTRSEGGMVTWDGCNSAGQRVKTGVYYVFASQSEDGQNSSGAVTKILVVN